MMKDYAKDYAIEIGRVALSKAGRDAGKTFMIIDVLSDDYVMVVDGTTRKIAKPKKKKIKHLSIKPFILDGIQKKILEGQQVFDAEIRKKLDSLGFE